MKKQILFSLIIVSTALSLMSNRGGRTTRTGQGATTAPGETGQFCGSFGCHSGTTFGANVMVALIDADGNPVQQYTPGEDYTVNVNIGHTGTPAGYGFQIVSLRDSDDTGVNNFFDLPTMTQEVMSMSRQYIEQSDRLESDEISIKWTAPENGTGDITFYASGNAVNGNGGSSGDSGDTTRITITENIMSSILTTDRDESSVVVYPNPTSDFLYINDNESYKSLQLLDEKGAVIRQVKSTTVDLRELSSGLYYLRVMRKDGTTQVKQVLRM